MKKQNEKTASKKTEKPETKTEKTPITFASIIKAMAKTFFILFADNKQEIAIVKEKKIDISSPKNVLHVFSTEKGLTGNYEETIKSEIGIEALYTTKRTSKGNYVINPVLAGIMFHFCERMAIKRESILKSCKDKNKAIKLIKAETKCDRLNFNKFICKDLDSMIAKDFPSIKQSDLNAYLVVDDCEKGKIAFITK